MATDYLGLRDVIVAIWGRTYFPYPMASAGHVFVGELNGKTILSSFPNESRCPRCPQITRDWFDTATDEWRAPDAVFKVFVPDDGLFNAKVAELRGRGTWVITPQFIRDSTNCSTSAFDALKAGGVNVDIPWLAPSPNDFLDDMWRLAKQSGSGVQKLNGVPW